MATTGPKRLGICGFKKSGKTALIEKLIIHLGRRGLRLGVIKRQNEPVQTDQPGADTYRFYQAGAEVLGWDGQSVFVKRHQRAPFSVEQAINTLGEDFDLVLVEGYKKSDIDKIWLLRPDETFPPAEITHIIGVLEWSDDRPEQALTIINNHFNFDI